MALWDVGLWDTFTWADGVVINGVYKENTSELEISDLLTKEANSCSFLMQGTYAEKPAEGQIVRIRHKGVKIFAGRIVSITSEKLSANIFNFSIECVDWQGDLDRKLVIEVYEGKTLNYIINDINTNYCTGFTTTNVADPGETINRIQFNYVPVSEAFSQIAEMTGYDWYIDYDQDIHFFPIETNNAPIELLDGGTEFNELVITPDNTQIANRVWVRGGYYQSDQYTQDTITAAAGQKDFDIKYKPHDLSVTVDGAPKTVGIQFIDDEDGTFDFLMNYNEKNLKADKVTYATGLTGGEAVVMKYDYEIPIIALVEDIGSQSALKILQGGDGKYEKHIQDENITTLDQARERGQAELNMYANPLIEGSFTSLYPGWKSGQRLHIKLTDRNIDEYYMIREVTITAIGGDNMLYTVTFATSLQGFTWLLIKILDSLNRKAPRDDEIIDQISPLTETVTPSDAAPTSSSITPPYEYGPGGVPQGVYNESVYS